MQKIDKYLLTSSVVAIFTEAFTFHYFIDLKLFYVILIVNFFIIASKYKLTIHKNLIIIITFFLIHGIVTYLLFSNPILSLVAQLLGIAISSIYFYNLIKIFKVKVLIEKYLTISFFLALLAIPMFYLNINVFNYDRLNGVLSEPAHYASIMLPAVYLFFIKKEYFKFAIVLLTIFLTKSSIGLIGLLLIIIIPLIKTKYFLKYALVVFVIIGSVTVFVFSKWDEKVDENDSNKIVRRIKETKESLSASYTGKFKEYTNLSSYAFLSNLFITQQIIFHKPFGTGIGSYKHEYEKYYYKLTPPKYLIKSTHSKINKTDANSLLLRMIADLGVFSILFFIFFIYWALKLFKNDNRVYQKGTFFYLSVKLLREGHYFPPEFYFFLLIFLKNDNENTTHS